MITILRQSGSIVEFGGLKERKVVAAPLSRGVIYQHGDPAVAGPCLQNEKFLVGETGTIRLLVVESGRGPPDELDRRAQLYCAKQSAPNEKG